MYVEDGFVILLTFRGLPLRFGDRLGTTALLRYLPSLMGVTAICSFSFKSSLAASSVASLAYLSSSSFTSLSYLSSSSFASLSASSLSASSLAILSASSAAILSTILIFSFKKALSWFAVR